MKKLLLTACCISALTSFAQVKDHLLYGVAYYDEYMPYDRLDKDIAMMKAAHINVVRIAESTWATEEPSDSVYNFTHIDRVLNAMHKAGISVIVGTPTYAVPAWLAKKYPDVLATTPYGQNQFGPRQNMDITNPHYRYYAERIIRKIMEHVKDHPAIIGYQVDNETKAYNTAGPDVQKAFVEYLQKKFITLDSVNNAFGLNYWSNRISTWDDFPSVNGSVNASVKAEFAKFQRQLVTEFLAWQAKIVREYKRPDQFITQNFDLSWKGYSYGIQDEVDHFAAAKALDIAGIDIYHPSQNQLTGAEISLGGDLARSMKGGQNYLVIETEAQGFANWTPYPGQLRLQAFSHLASGADMVSYWHWASIHNSAETYWKGLLSHDFAPNPTYNEAITIGADFDRLSKDLLHLSKKNEVAIFFSNEANTAFNAFSFGWGAPEKYNDIMRPFYDALYRMNIGVDFIDPSSNNLDQYKMIVVPALYAASDSLLQRLNKYVGNGGHIVYTFKSGFSNENVQVRYTPQPGGINAVTGNYYSQFVVPEHVGLKGDPFGAKDNEIKYWMELVTPTTAKVLAYYDHAQWGQYAAVTRNQYGKGTATYIAFMPGNALCEKIMENCAQDAGIIHQLHFPLIIKTGKNPAGRIIHYLFNYSDTPQTLTYPFETGKELLSGKAVNQKSTLTLAPWDVKIIENN